MKTSSRTETHHIAKMIKATQAINEYNKTAVNWPYTPCSLLFIFLPLEALPWNRQSSALELPKLCLGTAKAPPWNRQSMGDTLETALLGEVEMVL